MCYMKKTVITSSICLSPVECSILSGFGEGYNEVTSSCKNTITMEKKEELHKLLSEKQQEFNERITVVIQKRRFYDKRIQTPV